MESRARASCGLNNQVKSAVDVFELEELAQRMTMNAKKEKRSLVRMDVIPYTAKLRIISPDMWLQILIFHQHK